MAVSNEEGQSLFEFLLMLPMLVGLTVILVRVNSAIQISIVNQQYARAQTLFLAFNNSTYPVLSQQSRLIKNGTNQLILGVSDNVADNEGYTPIASVQMITRNKSGQASDAPREEPTTMRARVRIRNSVTLCTPTFVVDGAKGASQPIMPLQGSPPIPSGPSALTEGTRFNFCGSKVKYEQ